MLFFSLKDALQFLKYNIQINKTEKKTITFFEISVKRNGIFNPSINKHNVTPKQTLYDFTK